MRFDKLSGGQRVVELLTAPLTHIQYYTHFPVYTYTFTTSHPHFAALISHTLPSPCPLHMTLTSTDDHTYVSDLISSHLRVMTCLHC